MGEIVPFRRRARRWTRPEDYGHDPGPPPRPPRQPRRGPRRSRFWAGLRPWLLLVVLLGLWTAYDPMLMEPLPLLKSEEEAITGAFVRCGAGRAPNCVIDGDTIRVGARSIRLIGIDAPETHPPRCESEAVRGVAATAALLAAVQKGPIVMVARLDRPTDDYGRELRSLYRVLPHGTRVSIADELVEAGVVRRYTRTGRHSWCPANTV